MILPFTITTFQTKTNLTLSSYIKVIGIQIHIKPMSRHGLKSFKYSSVIQQLRVVMLQVCVLGRDLLAQFPSRLSMEFYFSYQTHGTF